MVNASYSGRPLPSLLMVTCRSANGCTSSAKHYFNYCTPIYDYVNNQAVVNFKVTNTGAGQITAYQWNFGDGHTSNAVPDANGMVAHLFSITPNEILHTM
ncbi:hypothetical protein EJ377_01875 [Chryseobacterium arthrosphaerae]|uniref:PKD domain-containing protein n=1 Tax=Chryseobacterium arthrosphaerae TaxID=651561 RepID=A0A3S0N585_9FLAO|nr:hypothetical protein EJ377_01875 [Chryseobacterium arthrosphaerae]